MSTDELTPQNPTIAQLVAVRHRHGLSQEAVARQLGVSQAAISQMEAGITAPSFEQVRRYAAAVGAQMRVETDDACPITVHHQPKLSDADRERVRAERVAQVYWGAQDFGASPEMFAQAVESSPTGCVGNMIWRPRAQISTDQSPVMVGSQSLVEQMVSSVLEHAAALGSDLSEIRVIDLRTPMPHLEHHAMTMLRRARSQFRPIALIEPCAEYMQMVQWHATPLRPLEF